MNEIITFEELKNYVREHTVQELQERAFEEYLTPRGLPRECNDTLEDICRKFDEREYAEFSADSRYFLESIRAIKEHLDEFEKAHELMRSEKSKQIFTLMLYAKLHIDTDALAQAHEPSTTQYFRTDYFDFHSGEVYVDCGMYTGDTVLEFIHCCPEYRRIYGFEASATIAARASENLAGFNADESVKIFASAVGDGNHNKVAFSENLGKGDGKVGEGESEVLETTLDSSVDIDPTFIKFDIEGYEIPALDGAKKLIAANIPRMAICIYHKVDDFWKIPQKVLSINPNYTFEMTQYRKHEFYDTILYCIPIADARPDGFKPDNSILINRLEEIRKHSLVMPEEERDLFAGVYKAERWLRKTLATERRRIYYMEKDMRKNQLERREESVISNDDNKMLREKLAGAQDEVLGLRESVSQLKVWAEGLQKQVAACEKVIAERESEKTALREGYEAAQEAARVIQAEADRRQIALEAIEAEAEKRQERIEALQKQVAAGEAAIAERESEKAALQEGYEAAQEATRVIQEEADRRQVVIDDLQNWAHALQMQLQAEKKCRAEDALEAERQAAIKEKDCQMLFATITETKEKLEQARRELNEQEERNRQLTTENACLHADKDQLEKLPAVKLWRQFKKM